MYYLYVDLLNTYVPTIAYNTKFVLLILITGDRMCMIIKKKYYSQNFEMKIVLVSTTYEIIPLTYEIIPLTYIGKTTRIL